MTKYGSHNVAFLLVDGYSILGVQTDLKDDVEAITEETHALGDSWVEVEATGVKRGTLEQNGFYDDVAVGAHAALVSTPGQSRVVNYGVENNGIGQNAVCLAGAMQTNYNRVASRGELTKANASYQVVGEVEEGKIIHDLAQEAGDGDSTAESVDNAASSADGANLYLQVSALDLDGLTDVVISVVHSDDDISYSTLESFTAVTAAQTAEVKAKTGTIKRYLAAEWAFTGLVGESPTATFMVAVVRQ